MIASIMSPTDAPERYPVRFFDDFNVGDTFTTDAFPLTRDETLEFARQFDPQPFHLDDAAAQRSVFGKLSASGWHTAALTMRAIVKSGVMRGTGILGTGIDDLRWMAPVYPGDALHVEGEIVSLAPNPDGKPYGRIRVRLTTVNQNGVPVMSQIANLTAIKRPNS